jgi:GT2 family glycosyltransferase
MPTYNRPAALDRALARITDLDVPSGGYEVVIVDDGSPAAAGIPALLESWAARSKVPLRYESVSPNRGPCAARDQAWRMAAGEWIAFTDDDCVPEPDWLVRLLAAAEDADVVQGRTQPDPERAHLLSHPLARSISIDKFSDYFQTCNMLYRRRLLEELDGFDRSFRMIADDTDLGWRARDAGARIAFEPSALVTHDVIVGNWRREIKGRKRWVDVVRMVGKHPKARRLAWKPYIYRKAHLLVFGYAACAALALPRATRRLALLGGAGLLARDVIGSRSPRAAAVTMTIRAADAYEVALLARESVRQRTVLL